MVEKEQLVESLSREVSSLRARVAELEAAVTMAQTEDAFRKAVIDCVADGLCVCHEIASPPHVCFTVWSSRMIAITGYTMEEINRSGWYQTLYPDPQVRERAAARMGRMRVGDNLVAEEWQITRKDGASRTIAISTSVLPGHGAEAHVLAIMRDLTAQKKAEEEKKKLEAHVLHVQKLESLGVLAGGIAHDFNNLLTSILGNADLALRELPPGSPSGSYLGDIKLVARRAAELCQQMLAYSGKGHFVVQPTDLNALVQEMTRMLEVSISKQVTLRYDLENALPSLEIDATQIRQVLMNLITNASEAIGQPGGIITLATGRKRCDRAYLDGTVLQEPLPEGEYVYLEVGDTGSGMNAEVTTRIFDPFFSTKFTGRGLGMAAVLGIVRGHSAAIRVESWPGKGTTIRVLFPLATPGGLPAPQPRPKEGEWRGRGTILIVDDEEIVRTIGRRLLERMGFETIQARDGQMAVEIFRERQGEITCVLLDLTMPRMSGVETFRELRRQNHAVQVIITSGYNEPYMTQQLTREGLSAFLQKPFDFETLQRKLRQVLESGR